MISVVLPTYNESKNLEVIIPRICEVLRAANRDVEIIIVDDNSPDGTAAVAQKLAGSYPVSVIVRHLERGLSSAVLAGFEAARGDICVMMDADLSHPVEKLPEMIEPIEQGRSDATVASRYIAGGGCENWKKHRQVISRVSGLMARGITKLSDPTSGFLAIRKSFLNGIQLEPIGWKLALEIVTRTNARVTEVPIVFKDRLHGETKLTNKVILDYLIQLWRLYDYCHPKKWQVLKFIVVGFSGFLVDTTILIAIVELFGLDPRTGAICSFFAAVTWNYLLNRLWTFPYASEPDSTSFIRFLAVCLVGLSVRLSIMHLLMEYCGMKGGLMYVGASMIGIVFATAVNFVGAKKFAFAKST